MLGRLLTPLLLVGLFAIPCLAQTDNASATPGPASPTTPAPANSGTSASKKVWTNENLPAANATGPAANGRQNQNRSTSPNQTADAATVARIRKNLEKLQGQLDDVNAKLKSYKEFQQGEAVSTTAREMNKGVNRVPVDQQIVQLEEKKKQLEAQIGDLYDEARKKGVEPGQLR